MKNVLFAVAALAALAVTARPAAAQYPAPGYGPTAYGPVVQAGCTQCGGGSGYGGHDHGWGFGLKDKLFGHLHGMVEDYDTFFEHQMRRVAQFAVTGDAPA